MSILIKFILYDWYWYMAYTYSVEHFDDNFIFPEFDKTVFKSGKLIIDPRSPICYKNSMNVSMALFSNTEKVSKRFVKKMANHVEIMCLHVLKFYIMLLILYCTPPLN